MTVSRFTVVAGNVAVLSFCEPAFTYLVLLLSFLAQNNLQLFLPRVTLTANQLNSSSFILVSICMCSRVSCASSVHINPHCSLI